MVSSNLDSALIAAYEQFDVPVDRFLGDDALTQEFIHLVANRFSGALLDSQDVMRRLMILRKKGQLPRLRRAYFGRNGNNN
jgi:hypothetical protein